MEWAGFNIQHSIRMYNLPEAGRQLSILQDFGKNPVLNVFPRSPKHEGNGL